MVTDEYPQRHVNQGQFPAQEEPVSASSSYSRGQREEPRTRSSNGPITTTQPAATDKRFHNKRRAKVTWEPLFRQIEIPTTKNIVIFGETGTGKSSLINMLSDHDVAGVSNGALGCTFESARYPITIGGMQYTLWDSAGLNEGEAGSVPATTALNHLRDLVENLKDGVSLLVYCIRGARYRDIIKVNYDLFTEIICQSEVPVVVVVTGLENEARMEDWWVENEREFTMRNMHFVDHACVTTSKGKKNMFEEEYEESKQVVRDLIQNRCPNSAWTVDSQLWFNRITDRIQDYYDEYNGYSRPTTAVTRGGAGDESSKGAFTLLGEMVGHLAKAASTMYEIISPRQSHGLSAGGLEGSRRDAMEE